MQTNNRDAASVWDMVQAIRRIQEFTAGLSFDDYQASLLIQSAVERQLKCRMWLWLVIPGLHDVEPTTLCPKFKVSSQSNRSE